MRNLLSLIDRLENTIVFSHFTNRDIVFMSRTHAWVVVAEDMSDEDFSSLWSRLTATDKALVKEKISEFIGRDERISVG